VVTEWSPTKLGNWEICQLYVLKRNGQNNKTPAPIGETRRRTRTSPTVSDIATSYQLQYTHYSAYTTAAREHTRRAHPHSAHTHTVPAHTTAHIQQCRTHTTAPCTYGAHTHTVYAHIRCTHIHSVRTHKVHTHTQCTHTYGAHTYAAKTKARHRVPQGSSSVPVRARPRVQSALRPVHPQSLSR
jgi:hypothetical protein